MTPGVVANVREVISSSLRSWIIESLDHFGVDSRVFLHVIQSILEQDVRSLRGEDALDDLWRGQLASIGSKRGRDPKRQMNEDDLRRCVLLENMTACFKEDEFDAAEEFVDELLNRWTEEARVNVEVNGDNMKKSSQDLHEEEIDNEENKETKDPVREYNEAFPALRGSSTRPPSMANQMECAASETTGRQKRNCAVDLLKDLFHWSASSRNNPENVCSKESMCSSMVRAKCCREFAKSMARDFVNNSVAANTQQSDSVRGVCSKELLGHSNIVVSDLSRRFLGNELRSAGISSGERDCRAAAAAVSSGWTLGDSSSDRRGLSLPSLQRDSTHELNSHLREMSNNTLHCPSQGEGNKIFPPLSPEVLSRTVDRILSQSLPCCNEPRSGPNTGGAYHECIQCNSSGGSGRLDFPIYTENEFGMLIRLGEDWNERRTNQRRGYGEGVIGDASHLVVGVGNDASPGSSGTLLSTEAKGKMSEEVDLSLHPVGSSGVRRDPETLWQYPSMATSGWKGGGADEDAIRCCICETELQQQKSDDADAGLGCQSNSHHSSALRSGLFSHLNHDAPDAIQGLRNNRGGGGGGQCLTGKVQPGGFLPGPTHGKIGGAVETATASSFSQVKGPSDRNGFQCSGEINERSSSDRGHRMTLAAAEVSRDLTDVSMVGWTRPQMKTMKRNAEESSSVVCHPPDDGDDGALVASRDRDTVVPSASVSSDDGVLRLLADVIERDLMNHIAASLIPLFPDLSSPRGLFLPAEQMLAHLAARNCIPERGCADALASHTLCTGTCENDYVLYLHLAVRQESLHVDHVLNFQDFCVWRQCLLEQATSATNSNISCICDLCHRALKHLASDSRYAFVDANTEEESRKPLPDSSSTLALESETSAKSEKKDLLRSEKQEPEKRDDDSGFHFSSKPAFLMNSCLQSAESAGTGDFTTGKFDGIMMNKVPPGGGGERDGSHGCSSVGEGDVLLEKHSHIWDNFGVFGQNSLREIWHPDGDADRKSDFVGCSELKEQNLEENNNILESFGWLSETGFSWPSLSQGVALGNSVNIWFNSGSSSLASAGTSSRKAVSTTRICDKTVLRDIASDASISGASKFNTDGGHAIDLGATSAGTVSDKVARICDESASTMCSRPFSDQSALITDSFGESSFSTASSCHAWSCADDVTETEAMSSAVAPSSETSELKRLSPSLERLLSSGEESSSSSVQSFQSALHEDFYSLWLNTGSPTSDHESGRLCAREVSSSSDCGSLSLGSDDDEALLRNSEAHYEADISSSDDSSLDERGSMRDSQSVDAMQRQTDRRENLPPSEADLLFGLSFPPSKDRCSFSSVVGIDDIVRTKHSKCQSSESSLDDSSDRSEMSKPYSADCNSSGEHIAAEEERKGLLSDWDVRQRRPDLEGYGEGLGADCYQTDSEDLEDPTTLCRNWEECSSGNSAIMMPACSVNLFPDLGNLGVETGFSGNQQEVVDFEKFMKLKSIWNESEELDDFKYLTSDCEPQESRSVNFKEESFSETFGQHDVQDDMKRRLPSCSDLECSASENYRKLAILWDQTKVESLTGARALWESNDLESLKALVPNQVVPELKGGSGVTPDWNMTEHPAENLGVLDADWNEQEPGGAMVLNWNTLHQPIGDGCTDQTSCWGQQWSKVENLKGSTLGHETVDDLKEFTEKHDTVVDDDNFKEVESIWVGLKSLESFKGDRTVRANPIEDVGNNSIHALVLDCNEQESNSVNLRNLAGLKSLWEKEELHPETSSNDLKVDCWDLSQMRTAVDLALGGCHQTTDNGSCKDLTELKLIWEENQMEPCLASSRGVLEEQGWEMNPMGCVNVGNAKELAAQKTTMWDGNQRDGDDLLERECCDQQEVDARNVERNLVELKFIWEDKPPPPKAEVDLTTSYKSDSAILNKKLMPSCSDYNLLNAEELLGGLSATSNAQHQASNLEMSKGVRFIWESVDRGTDENANAPNWDQQQELGTENTARGLPDNGPLLTASDLEGCFLLTSIWERRESDSGRNTTWEVPGSRPEENAVVTMIPIFDTNHKVVAGYAGDNDDVGDVQNLAQSLWKGKQKNLESFIWDMNGNDGGETGVAGLATCDRNSQESDAEALKNQIQLESLWRESESKLRSAKLNWDMEPSDAENLMSLTPDQSQEDAGPPDSFQNLKSIWDEKLPDSESGLMLGWDVNALDAAAHSAMRIASDQSQQQEAADPRNFQTLGQLKSIWEEKEPDTEHSKEPTNLNNWDISRMETLPHAVMGLPSCSNQQETDPPGNFLNLSEVKFIWEGKQSSSDNLEKAASCWEKQAPDLENRTWDKNQQTHSENLMMLKSGAGQQENEGCRNLKSIWEEQQPGVGSVKGPTSCWKQQGVESEVLKAGTTSNWNVTHLNSESFDNSLFDLNSRQLESENFESVMSSHGDIKQSNSEIFLDRKLPEPKCFQRPMSDRDLNYREFGRLATSNVDLWQSDSDELKQMISRWDKQQTEARGIRGLLSHFDSQQQSNLAAEWQLAEAVDQLTRSSDDATTASSLWRLASGRLNEQNNQGVLPKLVPSENSAFQDEIPRRFVYRYAFFDPRDVRRRGDDLAMKDARTETIRHIYEPSNSIVRQLEDLFDDGQRLHSEQTLSNLPNCLFRPIGEQSSGRDSHQNATTSTAGDAGDLSLQIKSPSGSDPSEVVEPNSPYQLYLGVESQAFVPRFRVHKELEKSAQTGEATPPAMQNNECVFGMNVILSTIALLE